MLILLNVVDGMRSRLSTNVVGGETWWLRIRKKSKEEQNLIQHMRINGLLHRQRQIHHFKVQEVRLIHLQVQKARLIHL